MNELVRFALVALFPAEGDLPGLADLGVDGKIAALRRDATWLFWWGLVGAAFVFQISPVFTVRRPWPAVLLTPEQLDEHAHRIAAHPAYFVRQIVLLLKLVGGLFWGQSAEIRARLELRAYPADPGSRRTERWIEPVAPKPEDRAPIPPLVQIGLRERERGRGAPDLGHSILATPEQVPVRPALSERPSGTGPLTAAEAR